jgi:hypothetical protein
MPSQKPPPESPVSGAGSADESDPMERFKSLTKGLLVVPLAAVKEAERKAKRRRQ